MDKGGKVGTRNVGLDLLKFFACFSVVGMHNGGGVPGNTSAVPVFMTIAFYFSIDIILRGDWELLQKRLRRIMYPFLFWSLLPYVVIPSRSVGRAATDLLWQLSFGSTVAPPLYFLLILAFFTLLLFCMNNLLGNWFWCGFVALGVMAILLQYTGLHILARKLPHNMVTTCGRIVELFPCSLAGALLYKIAPFNVDSKIPKTHFALLIMLAVIALVSRKVLPGLEGFGYQGIELPLMAVGLTVIAIMVGIVAEKQGATSSVVIHLASLAPGIYYAHCLVGRMIDSFADFSLGWARTVLVFLISAVIVFFMLKVPHLKRFVS